MGSQKVGATNLFNSLQQEYDQDNSFVENLIG
ncbi:hypothetical protein NTE_00023 [Candidatus Nitrososphaera evergladensis SR1]|uniref:Uncharacterized protein n=1 Tax=Candidatus Nitrososphaera evergladensis SR1 TaxID=1459636 RepID=A0A075MMP0_9ARCH|nr:hypothetical protein NTE_00023 [Candidatus Nitrososphaera evergladensis SR1]